MKKTMKKTLALILSAILALSLLSCGSQPASTTSAPAESTEKKDENVILVGMEVSTDGVFEARDANGDPWGVSIQIVQDFGKWLGKEIKIVDTAWDGLIPSLQTNKLDMVLSSMTITEERAKKVAFSDPYCNAYLAVLADSASGVSSVDDLNKAGMKIAVTTGSTGYNYAMKNLTNAEVLTFDDAGACITEVCQGKANGFIRDQLSVYRANLQNPDTTKAILIPIQDAEPWGAAFNLENTELRNKFNEFLKYYEADGGYDRLTETYMKEYKEAFDKLGFKWFFD